MKMKKKKKQQLGDWVAAAYRADKAGEPRPKHPTWLKKRRAERCLEGITEAIDNVIAKNEARLRAIEAEILGAWDDFDRPIGLNLD